MKLYNLIHKSGRRVIYFPLSQVNRMTVEETNHNFSYKDFKELSNKHLKPLLEQNGYLGEDYFYYRPNTNNFELIHICQSTSNSRRSICVNVQFKQSNSDLEVLNFDSIDKLRSTTKTVLGWKRLSPDEYDCWWMLRATELENKKVLEEIFKLIELEGEKYFRRNNK